MTGSSYLEMDYYIVIPAHNEEQFLATTLESVLQQSLPPKKVVVVDDNSTDKTGEIIEQFADRHNCIQKVTTSSSARHLPGSKVVNAFNAGLTALDEKYEFLVKLDADLILPENYFETIAGIFSNSPAVGIAGGFFYEKDDSGIWLLTHPMDKNHIRGAFKAYSKACFKAIGGLRSAMGWDTLDELLAQYHGFELHTVENLHVKNLRPIGQAYHKSARYLQGQAMYQMGYGFWITAVASLKMAWHKKQPVVFFDNIRGYYRAKHGGLPLLVNESEKAFIRAYRWRHIRKKLF